MMTGYFGIPGGMGGQVHVVKDGKPICGQHLHEKAVFQWCTNGIEYDYIECRRCKERAAKILIKEADEQREKLSKVLQRSASNQR